MPKTNTIYAQLLIPYLSILVIVTLIAWWLATSLFTNVLEQRLETQLLRAATILADGELPYTQSLVNRLGNLLKADIVLIKKQNEVGISTIKTSSTLIKRVLEEISTINPNNSKATLKIASSEGPHILVFKMLTKSNSQNYTGVIAVSNLNDVYQTSQKVAWWLATAGIICMLVLVIIGHKTARRITQPIQELVQLANRISVGDRSVRASAQGSIELANLANHFNHMTTKLEKYENEVAEQSKLATIGQVAARIAHEIRNPLTAIKMQIELLNEMLTGQEQATIRNLLIEIRRLESIVSNTLGMSQSVALQKADTDIHNLLIEIIDLFTTQFQHLNIQIKTNFSDKVPQVDIDANRIKQVLINLLLNASEALQRNGTILITTQYDEEKQTVKIFVDDSGSGIHDLENRDIFSDAESDKSSGFGLGLKICKELAELHGGGISAQNSLLGGARFIVDLPVEKEN